ncbi:TLC domain-containing protein [Lasiosphaeria miniovina]|uniref:TLC domain-containing protein n=1 Tax=Lasiosphaeria miniovina TaxID=1954250 RepID=A0AA40DUQ8_9PEZI|nr:TLC domain-containing protein [Lasiosphaeria miniovina]KAK0717109.1 TLC domain-containing protein [Lasiosphaeria miniovina]
MRDPLAFSIPALSKAVQPWADRLAFPVLPLHAHEVVGSALFYTFVHVVVSPALSSRFFPKYYPRHSRAKKANWDAHVVSLIQSVIINSLALWVIFFDAERKSMDWQQRVWGYTGSSAMIQALACGYFVWDLGITLLNLDIFGIGLLAHAVSALAVYSFGFRPFLNFYSPVFILYELSTPFLNIHWFFDKLNMTGSKAQLYNGIALLATFFSCRLVWGSYQSVLVYADMWRAVRRSPDALYVAAAAAANAASNSMFLPFADPDANMMAFVTAAAEQPVPVWLALVYVASNIILNTLNWHWFFKMITAVRKRFDPPKGGDAGKAAVKEEKKPSAVTTATGVIDEKKHVVPGNNLTHRRQHSIIEDVVPDSEELRDGTIQ